MKLDLDGRSAYAYTGGKAFDATRQGVVFVHGALNDHSVWILQSRYLAHHGHAVLAVDLPGHGRSSGPALGVAAAGAWVTALVRASGLRRATLVGHSMGSLIALEAATHLQDDAHHLVMVGTAYPMRVSPKLLATAREDASRAIDLVNALSHSTHSARPSCPGPGFSIHGGARALMRRMQRGAEPGNLFVDDFSACDAYDGLAAAAPRLRCPVTLVLGTRDQMTSTKAVAPLIDALRPRVIHLPCGHDLMAEAPDALLGVLREALSSD
jgi:pimeloyl-ACP methyl ester carboxylesterase